MKLNHTKEKEEHTMSSLNNLFKRYLLHYNLILVSVLLIHETFFYFEGNTNIAMVMFGFTLFLTLVTVVVYKLDYFILRHLITYYIIVNIALLNILLFVFWKNTPEVSVFILLIPLGIYNFYHFKTVIYWTVTIMLFFLIIILLPDHYYPDVFQVHYSAYVGTIKTISTFFIIGLFLLYYNILISNEKVKIYLRSNNSIKHKNDAVLDEEDYASAINETYTDLYEQIIDHFKSEPWKDPDFLAQDLAESLNTNTTYISRAININTGMNFKTFVNSYRINYIKEELKKDNNYNRYTLMYIYTSAGFRHQSTFNKTFKQFENMTPSEFINSLLKREMPDPIEEIKVINSTE